MNWIFPLAAAALLIRIGQAMYAAGTSRVKNAAGAVLRSLCDFCITILIFWAVGAALMFHDASLLFGWGGTSASALFGMALVLIGTGNVGATLGERSKLPAVGIAAAALAGLIMPIAGHLGWFYSVRFTDVGGAASIHLAAGTCALIGAIVIGARNGKYNRDGSTTMIPGHNVPLAGIGAMTMLAGFVPYVMATTSSRSLVWPEFSAGLPSQAAMNTLVSIAAAGMSAVAISRIRYGKADVGLALLGSLGGAVAITAAGGHIGSPAAFLTGAVAGVIVPLASIILDLYAHIDDPAGGVSVHLVGGLWGTLSAGFFLPGSFTDRLMHFGVQLLGAVLILLLSAAVSLGAFLMMKRTIGIRAKEADEFDGLDLAEHDIGAYPDFQQTMIKSYHLREA